MRYYIYIFLIFFPVSVFADVQLSFGPQAANCYPSPGDCVWQSASVMQGAIITITYLEGGFGNEALHVDNAGEILGFPLGGTYTFTAASSVVRLIIYDPGNVWDNHFIMVNLAGAQIEPPPDEPPVEYPPDEEFYVVDPPSDTEPDYTGREDGDGLDSDDDVPTLNQIKDLLSYQLENINTLGIAANQNLNNFRRTTYEQLNEIIALLGDIRDQGSGAGAGTVPESPDYSGSANTHEVLEPPEISYQDNNYRLFDFSNAFLNPSVGDGSSLALTLPLSHLSSSFDDVPVDFSQGVLNTLRLAVRTVLLGVLAFWFCSAFISITRSFEY